MRLAIGLLVICCFLPAPGQAQNLIGADLLAGCESVVASDQEGPDDLDPVQAIKTGYCLGTLQGITTSVLVAQGDGFAPHICYPAAGVRIRDLATVTVDFLRRNPQLASQDAALLATLALMNAYPCAARP